MAQRLYERQRCQFQCLLQALRQGWEKLIGSGKRKQILAQVHIVNAEVLVFGPVVHLLK